MTATATPSSHAFQTCSSNSAPDRRASLVGRTICDIRRPDVIQARDLQMAWQVGIDRVGGMPLAGARRMIHRRDPHACYQSPDALASNRVAFLPEQVPQQAASCKRIVQIQPVDRAYQYQLCCRHRPRLVIHSCSRELQRLAVPHDRQFVSSVDH